MSGRRDDRLAGLAARYGVARRDLLALSAPHDPYNTGTPAHVRDAEWFAGLYEELGRPRIHLRDIHYAVVVRGLALPDGRVYTGTHKRKNVEQDWLTLLRASSKARDLGLVDSSAFIDKRTQARYLYGQSRARRLVPPEIGWGEDERRSYLHRPQFWVPDWEVPEPELVAVPSALSLQPLLIELWIEKDSAALLEEVLPVAERYGCDVIVGVGYQSKVAAADLVRRAEEDGRDRVVLWLSDADASGESMPIATARHIEKIHCGWREEETAEPRILVDTVALTVEQLADIEEKIGRTIPVSPDVARAQGRVELQALAAFAPGWMGDELERRLAELTDETADDLLDEWEEESEELIEAAWEERIAASVETLVMLIANRDTLLETDSLAAIKAGMDELEPRRSALEDEIRAAVQGFDPALPELPEAVVDLDRRAWMFDSERGYLDQLNAYRRFEPVHRRREQLDFIEPTCLECGKPVSGRQPFCNDAHRKRWERRS